VAAIALGSNLGDRDAHLDHAVARLADLLSDLRVSSRYDTAPVGVTGEQPTFLNAAVVGTTTLDPRSLLRELQAIEAERGRERPVRNAPRTLDVDLVLYGDAVVSEPELEVPHPRFRDRLFVLEPLAEIAPELADPVTGLTVAALLRKLGPRSQERVAKLSGS
jgi:2-amino-4-hydroxy-6-hydroxymethyldihydropteridine diphosphokinase